MEQRRAANQCFKCSERYHPGHQCKNKSLFSMPAEDNVLKVYDEECLIEEEEIEHGKEAEDSPPEETEEVGLSFNALSRENQQQTLQIQREVGNKILKILVDIGSMHSVLDFRVAKEVKERLSQQHHCCSLLLTATK